MATHVKKNQRVNEIKQAAEVMLDVISKASRDEYLSSVLRLDNHYGGNIGTYVSICKDIIASIDQLIEQESSVKSSLDAINNL